MTVGTIPICSKSGTHPTSRISTFSLIPDPTRLITNCTFLRLSLPADPAHASSAITLKRTADFSDIFPGSDSPGRGRHFVSEPTGSNDTARNAILAATILGLQSTRTPSSFNSRRSIAYCVRVIHISADAEIPLVCSCPGDHRALPDRFP